MIKFLPLFFIMSCGPWRMLKKDYITLSESPCIDGTILNIDQAGCESFYWGTKPEGVTLKIRCTYAPKDGFWTRMTFYAVPHNNDLMHANWSLYCEDKYVKMYAAPTGVRLESIDEEASTGR
jgi:hypothetical protein